MTFVLLSKYTQISYHSDISLGIKKKKSPLNQNVKAFRLMPYSPAGPKNLVARKLNLCSFFFCFLKVAGLIKEAHCKAINTVN